MKIATGLSKCSGMFRCDRVNPRKDYSFVPKVRTVEDTFEEVVRAAISYNPPARREQMRYNKEIQDRDYKGRYVLKDN